jgi:hypothetical protein
LNPWHDTNPSTGGSIKYQTLGVPPYRRFVVSFLDVPMFSCNSLLVTNQLILYESTNCIASFMLNKPICYTWNSGNAVHALQNGNGLSATIVAGRNNTQWTTSSQGILFSPTCVPCSTSTTSQCATLLPIELIQFDGYSEGTSNILEWSTASEQNSDIFILERSEDGENFIPLDVVDAAGNSTSTIKYRSIDSNPIIGMNYYRLRNLDIDGTGDLSNVIAILFNPNEYKREFSLNNLNFPSCVYLS